MGVDPHPIRRGFADVPHGQMHFRAAGAGAPLLLLHSSPGSAKQMERLIRSFAPQMRVIAPDTPGNGDSDPLPGNGHEITDLARAMWIFMDAQGIEAAYVYGMHTGAAIAAELALLAPERVRGVMLDGLTDMQGAELGDALAHYAAPFEADLDGSFLTRLFAFCRDQYLFYPWHVRTREARRDGGLPPADDLAGLVLEAMKARTSYHHNYHAAFRWQPRARLPMLTVPALLTASEADPLFETTKALSGPLPFAPLPRFDAPDFAETRRIVMARFMGLEA